MVIGTVGCGEGQSVSGTVTANGSPLPVGHIGFAPADGSGQRVGSEIRNGAYSVDGLSPGKYQVYVTGSSGDQPKVESREQAQRLEEIGPEELVSMDHPKNGQVVEIASGTSMLDFEY